MLLRIVGEWCSGKKAHHEAISVSTGVEGPGVCIRKQTRHAGVVRWGWVNGAEAGQDAPPPHPPATTLSPLPLPALHI